MPRLLLIAVMALTLTACAGTADDRASDPPPTATGSSGAAGGTTMRVFSVGEALQEAPDTSMHVVGLLIDDGSGWRLCDGVLESYPPQCGGPSVIVEGVDPEQFVLEEASGVRWDADATVVGRLSGDTLTVTGSAAAA